MIDVSPDTTTLATTYTWQSKKIESEHHREVGLYGTMPVVGSAGTLTLRFDSSLNGTDWYPILDEETGLPVEKPFDISEFGTAWNLKVQVPSDNFIRVQAKVDDITGAPSMTLTARGDGALL